MFTARKGECASFTFTNGNPFGSSNNTVWVGSGSSVQMSIGANANQERYLFTVVKEPCQGDTSDTASSEKKPFGSESESRDGHTDGLTGSLQVGTGGGMEDEVKKP
jgi:hypothetical protein